MPNADKIFFNEYGNDPNCLTPNILGRGMLSDKFAYELSWGEAFLRPGKMFGVTVVEVLTDKPLTTNRRTDLGNCFSSRGDAEKYIEGLTI